MGLLEIVLTAAATFGICFLADKVYTMLFRSKPQHKFGKSVRLSKRYGSFGLILFVFGVAAFIAGLSDGWVLVGAGLFIILMGIALVVYYMTFSVFYDEDCFILTTFSKKAVTYRYRDIQAQQLYNSSGNIVIELYMADGRSVQLQSAMTGVYPFLDQAFESWLRQTGKKKEDCAFYDPYNSCWFPPVEG